MTYFKDFKKCLKDIGLLPDASLNAIIEDKKEITNLKKEIEDHKKNPEAYNRGVIDRLQKENEELKEMLA